jgi:hypothetical protein
MLESPLEVEVNPDPMGSLEVVTGTVADKPGTETDSTGEVAVGEEPERD